MQVRTGIIIDPRIFQTYYSVRDILIYTLTKFVLCLINECHFLPGNQYVHPHVACHEHIKKVKDIGKIK